MKLQNTKQVSFIGVTTIGVILSTLSIGCGRNFQGPRGETGAKGEQGYGAGVIAENVPGLCGIADGVRLTTFQDKNNNGFREADEPVNAVTTVCNGSNGQNGSNGTNGTNSTISVSTVAASCGAWGGYTLTTTSGTVTNTYPICNGVQGSQGMQGVQGLSGLDGAAGTVVTPIKFCASDHSAYPEYGLYIGGRLFAVYWGPTLSSSASQAFLAEILPGNYSSTGGNNCAFTVNSNGVVQ